MRFCSACTKLLMRKKQRRNNDSYGKSDTLQECRVFFFKGLKIINQKITINMTYRCRVLHDILTINERKILSHGY